MSPADPAEPVNEAEPAVGARPDEPPGARHDDGREGVEHLQRAAHEMIAAARSFLDVVEDVVGDSAAVASVADVVGSVSQAVARAGGRARDAATASADGTGPDDGDDGTRVQHIDVS